MTSDSDATGEARTGGSSEQTRVALVMAALNLFGRKGFEGTSTREIAAAANANIGSIAYHFANKEGLRIACAEHIAGTMSRLAGDVLAAEPGTLTRHAARALLRRLMATIVGFLLMRDDARDFAPFMLRELSQPTAALETIYRRLFEPVHGRLCEVWAAATGENPEGEATRLVVFSLIGQVVYFRIARDVIARRMGWPDIGPAQRDAIIETLTGNLDAILTARTVPAAGGP